MRTFVNRSSDVLLPFVQPVPFPIGCISYMSICTKTKQAVYVTSISSFLDGFFLSVSALDGCHCSFSYKDSLTLLSTDLYGMFGIVTLAHTPMLTFSYSGRWKVHNRYVQVTRSMPGYTLLYVNNTLYPVPLVLDMNFTGAVDVSDSTVGRQDSLVFGIPSTNINYVRYINNSNVLSLDIKTSDSSILILLPVVLRNLVTVYINSRLTFPTCEG